MKWQRAMLHLGFLGGLILTPVASNSWGAVAIDPMNSNWVGATTTIRATGMTPPNTTIITVCRGVPPNLIYLGNLIFNPAMANETKAVAAFDPMTPFAQNDFVQLTEFGNGSAGAQLGAAGAVALIANATPCSNVVPAPVKVNLIKPTRLFKFVSKGTFPLPDPAADNPTAEGGSLRFVDDDGQGQTYLLDASGWTGLGPGGDGSRGFKFRGTTCRVVLVKENILKGVCKDDTGTFTVPETGDVSILLLVGDGARYCGDCGGTPKGNPDNLYKRKDCIAPSSCPDSPSGAFLDGVVSLF